MGSNNFPCPIYSTDGVSDCLLRHSSSSEPEGILELHTYQEKEGGNKIKRL